MSEITWQPNPIAGLQPTERAFRIDSGIYANELVKVTQTRIDTDDNQDGIVDHIHLKTTVEFITEAGETQYVGTEPLRTVGKVDSINMSGIEEGNTTYESERAQYTDNAIFRAIRRRTNLEAWAQTPK
jgi:hypothetical protein